MTDAKTPEAVSRALARRFEEIAAISQIGLTYATDRFDIERYHRLRLLSAEMIGLITESDPQILHDWLNLQSHYATPKIEVRGVILRGDRILLVRERSDGCWTAPGGWCDVNESASESIIKEVREESGLEIRPTRMLALFDKQKHEHPVQIPHAYGCAFLCEELGGALTDDTQETFGAQFWPLDALPPLSLSRITPAQIARLAALARDPLAPTAFD